MPRIDADALASKDFAKASITYGVSRAGKSVFGATFPKPAIIVSLREGGYMSIQTMEPALRYEPKVKPLIYAVSTIRETAAYYKEILALVHKGKVQTIVIELSFYSDDVVQSMTTAEEKNAWAKYKTLEDHLKWLDASAKATGARIHYNALAADPGDLASKTPAGILIAGKATGKKLPASTDFSGYLRAEDRGNNVIDRVLHLSPYGAYPAGHRYGARLPRIVRNPTYRKLEDIFFGRAVTVEADGTVRYGDARDADEDGLPSLD